ncbi:FixH family protein, partial [Pseudooceanicola nitratireducens]
MTHADDTGFRLKGWHVLAGFTAAFGIIITVNLVMATQAIRTFPGLEVKNSYVASQEFDDRRAEQQALGWTIFADW